MGDQRKTLGNTGVEGFLFLLVAVQPPAPCSHTGSPDCRGNFEHQGQIRLAGQQGPQGLDERKRGAIALGKTIALIDKG